jgi:pimeloyl-ACP methyl ester carboxylesterase
MQEHEIVFDGKKIFYRTTGKGPVVVLLHGFGEDGSIWSNQYDALNDFQLVIPDLPGSGGSDITADMSMEGMAASVDSLLSNINIDRCTIIGHSMGGYVTLAFAEKYPGKLNGFGLFHSTAYADSEEKKETRRKGIDFIEKNGAFPFLKTSVPNLYSPDTKKESPGLIEQQIKASTNFSGAALVHYYRSMIERPDRTDVLKNSRMPVLFILGKYDVAVQLKDGLEQCTLPELSYIHILESSGHMGMIEEPKRSNQILINYLKNLDHQTR